MKNLQTVINNNMKILLLVLTLCSLLFVLFVSATDTGQIETIEHGRKIVTNDEVSISAKVVEHCAWKPDSINDGYKVCEAVIEGYNPNQYELTVDVFKFLLNKEDVVKNKNYDYYFSNQFELYNETIWNRSCTEYLQRCYYEVERKRFYNWTYLGDKTKTTYDNTDFAYRVDFEFPQYEKAFYNFSISYKKQEGSEIPILLDPDISECGDLNTADATYTLNQNITNVSGECLHIKNENITVDMNGFLIEGRGLTVPVGLSAIVGTTHNTSVIKDGNITNFIHAVRFSLGSSIAYNHTIQNITFTDVSEYCIGVGAIRVLDGVMYNMHIVNIDVTNGSYKECEYPEVCDDVYITGTTNVYVNNSVFDNIRLGYDGSGDQVYNVIVLNSTYSDETVHSGSNLTRKWFFDGQVNYTHNGTAVNEANVSAYNVSDVLQFTVLSSSDGSIAQQTLTGYVNVGGTKTYYNNHTLNATLSNWDTDSHSLNITDNTFQQFSISDTTSPVITLTRPESQVYSYNESLPLNYTVSDIASGVDKCWYKVVNSTSDIIIDNVTLTDCLNTTFDVPNSDTYTLTLYSNDTVSNVGSDAVTFSVSLVAPAIVLNYPIDNIYFDSGINLYFNFTATDVDGLSTCELWGNWSTGWHNNYTWINPTNDTMNWTQLNITVDNSYDWNVWCNDTSDNSGWALNNFTFTIDTVSPNVVINYIDTWAGSRTIEFNATSSDTNLDSCWYSIFNSTGGIDGSLENVSYVCANVIATTVSAFATYNLTVYANDSASNENSSTESFTVSTVPAPPGGGGAVIIIGTNETAWSVTTTVGGEKYEVYKIARTSRSWDILFQNLGESERTISLSCTNVEGTLCRHVEIENVTFKLPVAKDVVVRNSFTINFPDKIVPELEIFNIVGTDELGQQFSLTVEARKTNIFTIAVLKLFTSRNILGTNVPYILIFIIIALVAGFTSYVTIFKKAKKATTFSVLFSILIGFISLFFI